MTGPKTVWIIFFDVFLKDFIFVMNVSLQEAIRETHIFLQDFILAAHLAYYTIIDVS